MCRRLQRPRARRATRPRCSHLVVPDGVFVKDGEGLRFEMLPVPTNAEVLAILDRIMRRIARRLAEDAGDGNVGDNAVPDVIAQVQAEAAGTWRSPRDASTLIRGAERQRTWCVARDVRCMPAS